MRTFLAVVLGIAIGAAVAVTVAAREQQSPAAPAAGQGDSAP